MPSSVSEHFDVEQKKNALLGHLTQQAAKKKS